MYKILTAFIIFAAGLHPTVHADLERGKAVYKQICFTCHGPKLDGGIGPVLNDAYWRHGSSPQAILESINKGVPNTEMIAFEAVYPESDRLALRDYIVSEQEGLREMMRAVYPREHFKGKRFAPALFDAVESLSQTALPENHFYFERNLDGILRGTAKLYIREAGTYRFVIRPGGRTSVFVNGEEVYYADDQTDKATHFNQPVSLSPGVHELEVLHEEKKAHSYRFHGYIQHPGGKRFALTGRSLEGNVPKIIKARPQAQVVRKWIQDLPPRTLLCLLPNQVIVAYNPVDGQVLKAWHSAEINQTPSLPARSQQPSELTGTPLTELGPAPWKPTHLRFLGYEIRDEHVLIDSQVDGRKKTLVISPQGEQSFTLSVD